MPRRKLRHPHQVMDASELVVGEWYRFVTRFRGGSDMGDRVAMLLGTVRDSPARARLRGFDPDGDARVGMFFDLPPSATRRSDVWRDACPELLTVHEDGRPLAWHGVPALVYWNPIGDMRGWDHMSSYMGAVCPGRGDNDEMHSVMVPETAWVADPRLHVVDWENPPGSCRRARKGTDRQRDDNLRSVFG